MQVSTSAIVPLYIVSFLMYLFQYRRIDPDRRVLDLRFGMMLGAVLLMFASNLLSDMVPSVIFLGLALFWLGLALYLFRMLPPPKT